MQFTSKNMHRLKGKSCNKIFQAKGTQKESGISLLILGRVDFKSKADKRDKKDHYVMIKVPIQQEEIAIVNKCTQ